MDPDDAEAWKRLGQFHGHGGRIKEALAALNEAVRLAPRDQESIKLRKNLAAEGALQTGRYDKAGSSRELMKDQDEARRLENEDRRQLTEEHAASEVDEVQLRIKDNPDDSRLWLRLADLHLHQNHEKRALEALEKAASLDFENYDLRVRVGDMKLRRLQDLAREAKQAAEAAPDDAGLKEALQTATLTFLQAQRKEYAKRVDAHPLDLKERFRLGGTLLALNEVDAAAAEFQQTVRDPKRKSESLLLLAQCFEKKNLTGLAIKKLEEAVQEFPALTSPQSKDVYYTYAALLERIGQREEARKVFEQIFEVDITYRDVSKRLETLTQG
jgi:tetratricopeptide (TPR) repeat protein